MTCCKNSRENLRILHPLPRVNEIAYDVDDNPKAYYIQQARNGLFARQAIICGSVGQFPLKIKNTRFLIFNFQLSIFNYQKLCQQQKQKRIAGRRFRERYCH